MATAQKLYTAEEFFLLPRARDGGKSELVQGRVCVAPPVGEEHGERALDIGSELRHFVKRHQLGVVVVETGFQLATSPDTVRAPDVAFIASTGLRPGRDRKDFIAGPPTLAVEVVSPTDREPEIARKVSDYLDSGAARVWVVRPDRATITVHRSGRDARTLAADGTLTSDDAGFEAPGFTLSLSQLFA
jgi:Uma2 family endonuclease